MIGYKLFRQRRDGSLGPLFINRRQRIPLKEWLVAKDHPTKGYVHRPGWHACFQPVAPHLKKSDDRVWCKVELRGCKTLVRPERQGGKWVLAQNLRVLQIIG
jgi:hypothetical protein